MRRSWRYALGVLLIAALGCKSHPELSKTNDKGSSEWKHFGGGTSTVTVFSIKAGNRIDTPAGEKLMELAIDCDGFHKLSEVQVAGYAEPENGAVSIGFDGGGLSSKTWEANSTPIKDHVVYTLSANKADRDDVLRQLQHANNFIFEFTPKGGKPQRSNFKLLNIGTLLSQDQNCKETVARIQ